jgi:peptidoglycan-N-acetylglucosamine deacetylase
VALHVVGACGLAVEPSLWPLALSAVLGNHLGLTALGLWPRSSLLGPNLTRLSEGAAQRNEVGLSFDDGPNPQLTPWVLDQLDSVGAKASFFCIGDRVREHPKLALDIVRRGHSIENHSQHHRHTFATFGMARLKKEIDSAQNTIVAYTGQRPTLFRAPAGLRSPLLEPVLSSLDLRLASWTRRGFDTREKRPDRVLKRLCTNLQRGDILLMHDGNAATTPDSQFVLKTVLPELLRVMVSRNLRCVSLAGG